MGSGAAAADTILVTALEVGSCLLTVLRQILAG